MPSGSNEKLGDAQFYVAYHRICGSIAQKSLIHWLRLEDPQLCQQVESLIAKEEKKRGG